VIFSWLKKKKIFYVHFHCEIQGPVRVLAPRASAGLGPFYFPFNPPPGSPAASQPGPARTCVPETLDKIL